MSLDWEMMYFFFLIKQPIGRAVPLVSLSKGTNYKCLAINPITFKGNS